MCVCMCVYVCVCVFVCVYQRTTVLFILLSCRAIDFNTSPVIILLGTSNDQSYLVSFTMHLCTAPNTHSPLELLPFSILRLNCVQYCTKQWDHFVHTRALKQVHL